MGGGWGDEEESTYLHTKTTEATQKDVGLLELVHGEVTQHIALPAVERVIQGIIFEGMDAVVNSHALLTGEMGK